MLIYREEPTVYVNKERGFFDGGEEVTLNVKNGFKLAFGVVDYNEYGKVYNDESRLNWVVNLTEYKNMKAVKTEEVEFHICTSEDYDDFFTISD